MDKQFALIVLLMLIGIGLTQAGDSDPFYPGLGWGTLVMASTWLVIRLVREAKKR